MSVNYSQENIPSSVSSLKLPEINLNVEELKQKMDFFSLKIDKWQGNTRKKLLEERNKHGENLIEDKEIIKNLSQEIKNVEKLKELYMNEILQEEEELIELEKQIDVFLSRKSDLKIQNEKYKKKLDSLKSQLYKVRSENEKIKAQVIFQNEKNIPELKLWEKILSLKIEPGSKEDELYFIFTAIEKEKINKEFNLLLNIASHDYEIISTYPKLYPADTEKVIKKLNKGRNFPLFLKEIRQLFKSLN